MTSRLWNVDVTDDGRTFSKFRLTCVARRLKRWAVQCTWRQAKNFQLSRGTEDLGRKTTAPPTGFPGGNERRRRIRLEREREGGLCSGTRDRCLIISTACGIMSSCCSLALPATGHPGARAPLDFKLVFLIGLCVRAQSTLGARHFLPENIRIENDRANAHDICQKNIFPELFLGEGAGSVRANAAMIRLSSSSQHSEVTRFIS